MLGLAVLALRRRDVAAPEIRGRKNVKNPPIYKATSEHGVLATEAEPKQQALRHILDAWEEAIYEGIDPDCIATAAIFAALSDMIATYGEEPVAKMTERLPERIRTGEFTIARSTQ
jgi:hypothetical protein